MRETLFKSGETGGVPAQPGPVTKAFELSREYAAETPVARRRESGQFFTPPEIASFMGELCLMPRERARLLDVGAGCGVLSCACIEWAACREPTRQLHVDAYEPEHALADLAGKALAYAAHWAAGRGLSVTWRVLPRDFVLAEAKRLTDGGLLGEDYSTYDAVIMNPPYFKVRKSSAQAVAASSVVYGQPNIYALCMAVGAYCLGETGILVSISPRSFTSGDYFQRFRKRLFDRVVPDFLHVFRSRKEAFRHDEVLQENVIARFRRRANSVHGDSRVVLSTSSGLDDLAERREFSVPLASIVDLDSEERHVFIPHSRKEERLRRWMRNQPETLTSLGLDVSTGPVVAFRARQYLVRRPQDVDAPCVPLLWVGDVDRMTVSFRPHDNDKARWIADTEDSKHLLLPTRNYVLLRRFTSKEQSQRIVAAAFDADGWDWCKIGFENHLNYIHCPTRELTSDETAGVAAYLNTRLVDTYFRMVNGHTQVNATEVRLLPFPPWSVLRKVGRHAQEGADRIDEVVAQYIGAPAYLEGV